MKIEEITISLHCGCSKEVVEKQVHDLKPLESMMKVHWNNRIDRYPKAYPSYSQLMNHAIATCPTEWMIFVNDRTTCTMKDTLKIIHLLETGFACALIYSVGYMGFSKELVRSIGWWDERYLLGGWEDRDWIFRLAQADLAIYESQEGGYDYSWKSPLQVIGHGCKQSEPHWNSKWEGKFDDAIVKMIPEERYEHWNLFLGQERPDIRATWKKWGESKLGIDFDKLNSGPSSSSYLGNRKIFNYNDVKHRIK